MPVAVDVAHGKGQRVGPATVKNAARESAGTVPKHCAHVAAEIVGGGEVEPAVLIEVADGNLRGVHATGDPDRADRVMAGSVAQQQAHVATTRVRGHDI